MHSGATPAAGSPADAGEAERGRCAPWSARARAELAGSGRRSGGARDAVVELLGEQDCCLSAQEIADRLREHGSRVGLASVYRALDSLHGLGLVQRLDVGEGGARYEPVLPGGEHHHHVVCDRCGAVTAFSDPGLEEAIDALAERLRHRVRAHDVTIRGECPTCARRAAAAR